jgi:cytochrome c oxidase subunit 2
MTDTRDEFDRLFNDLYLPVMVVITLLVFAFVAFAIVRYRAGRGHEASQNRERTKLELAYVAVIAVVAATLVAFTFTTESEIDPVDDARTTIRVTAFQWGWRFDYPGGKTVVGNDRTLPVAFVPAGEPVRFEMTARDVIHSFWVPPLRFKRDAFPGVPTRFDLVFDNAGVYRGSCAEFCGLHHADMHFTLRAVPRDEFDRWVGER